MGREGIEGRGAFLSEYHQTPFVPSAREAGVSRDQRQSSHVILSVAKNLASPPLKLRDTRLRADHLPAD